MGNIELAIAMADDYLNEHRKSEAWRIIDMLRDELVRRGGPRQIQSWPELSSLPVGSVVLYAGRPYQKVRESTHLSSGKIYQHWAGEGSSSLSEDHLDPQHARTTVILVHMGETKFGNSG